MAEPEGQGADLAASLLQARPRRESHHVQPLPPQQNALLLLAIGACQHEIRPSEEDSFGAAVVPGQSGGLVGEKRERGVPGKTTQGRNPAPVGQSQKKLVGTKIERGNPLRPCLSPCPGDEEIQARQQDQCCTANYGAVKHGSVLDLLRAHSLACET